jgi:hypothetical protein
MNEESMLMHQLPQVSILQSGQTGFWPIFSSGAYEARVVEKIAFSNFQFGLTWRMEPPSMWSCSSLCVLHYPHSACGGALFGAPGHIAQTFACFSRYIFPS